MKKIFALFLSIIMVYNIPTTVKASTVTNEQGSKELYVASSAESMEVDKLAIEYLSKAKIMLASDSLTIGFTEYELKNALLGNPFSIYAFNEKGQFVPSNTKVYPIFCGNQIVGIMEIYYNSTDSEYYYTLGRAYADELNKLRYSSNVDFENIVFIGQVADKLFVTDGKNVDVILEMPVEKMPTVSVSELEEICTNLTVDESTDYAVICEPELDNVFTTQNIMPLVSIKDTRSLDVPHVEQTGVCGVAAWAAVLNYRFGTSYTNDSLALEMANGYTNGKYNAPNMGDYKNFANDKYDADCVYTTPPSFTTVLNTIADKKPIMGYWESGSGTNFSTHAILITGFSYLNSVPADRYYIVKNPWYTYTQWISVTDPDSVTYVNGTRTWSLKSAVY
ncbi:MAG: hypothetical protein HFH94_17825 [Lachnospiraceae bacterium]|nr:C39 family peptidase [uncultured Acetatifactor sp.]MCI9221534.1 hypothetical protein [Lachnospiraceae bacterium]